MRCKKVLTVTDANIMMSWRIDSERQSNEEVCQNEAPRQQEPNLGHFSTRMQMCDAGGNDVNTIGNLPGRQPSQNIPISPISPHVGERAVRRRRTKLARNTQEAAAARNEADNAVESFNLVDFL